MNLKGDEQRSESVCLHLFTAAGPELLSAHRHCFHFSSHKQALHFPNIQANYLNKAADEKQ